MAASTSDWSRVLLDTTANAASRVKWPRIQRADKAPGAPALSSAKLHSSVAWQRLLPRHRRALPGPEQRETLVEQRGGPVQPEAISICRAASSIASATPSSLRQMPADDRPHRLRSSSRRASFATARSMNSWVAGYSGRIAAADALRSSGGQARASSRRRVLPRACSAPAGRKDVDIRAAATKLAEESSRNVSDEMLACIKDDQNRACHQIRDQSQRRVSGPQSEGPAWMPIAAVTRPAIAEHAEEKFDE